LQSSNADRDELEHSVGLLIARFTPEASQIVHDTQVLAMMLVPEPDIPRRA
jgi:hypothetical protein